MSKDIFPAIAKTTAMVTSIATLGTAIPGLLTVLAYDLYDKAFNDFSVRSLSPHQVGRINELTKLTNESILRKIDADRTPDQSEYNEEERDGISEFVDRIFYDASTASRKKLLKHHAELLSEAFFTKLDPEKAFSLINKYEELSYEDLQLISLIHKNGNDNEYNLRELNLLVHDPELPDVHRIYHSLFKLFSAGYLSFSGVSGTIVNSYMELTPGHLVLTQVSVELYELLGLEIIEEDDLQHLIKFLKRDESKEPKRAE